jgi:Cdc6-like AAA superfamily ATPase
MSNPNDKWTEVSRVFTPSSPINSRDLFSGRIEQVQAVVNAINQAGQHVIIFGERGVGKTSLSRVINEYLPSNEHIFSIMLNCEEAMDYKTLFRCILSEIKVKKETQGIGFDAAPIIELLSLADQVDDAGITPNTLRHLFNNLGVKFIITLDEFDRLTDDTTKKRLADTIKNFSDYSVDVTFILVGVADAVQNLITDHESTERALVQVAMPRMSDDELKEIIKNGAEKLELSFQERIMERIVSLSQGLPHYAHLLSLHACQRAVLNNRSVVQEDDFDFAVKESIKKAQQSLKDAYYKATSSARGNLFQQVLLAAALAKNDDHGYFAAVDMKAPMQRIMGKLYEIAAFSKHIAAFCNDDRGPVLKQTGYKRRYRYRFINPLMEPYIILDGLSKGLIK